MLLRDKVCVITGAANGIGRAMARCFAAEGARLVLADLDGDRLARVAEELSCEAVVGNVTDPAHQAALLDRERVDVLVNNAGILDSLTPLGDLEDALWDNVMAVNATAPMQLSRAAVRKMLAQGDGGGGGVGGAIVNTCSAASLSGGRAGCAYTASKHALLGLTRSIAWYYGDQGIRCNAVAPGAIQTKIGMRGVPHEGGMARYGQYFPTIPPMGKSAEVAQVAAFLASDRASYVNGEIVSVDGGWNAF